MTQRRPTTRGEVDPERDVNTMAEELALSDMVILERRSNRVADNTKGARGRERDLMLKEQALLERVRGELEEGRPVVEQSFSREESTHLANYHLLSAKPMLVAYNVGEAEEVQVRGGSGPPPVREERETGRLGCRFAQVWSGSLLS